MRAYEYRRWDGTQEIEALTERQLMEHIADRVLDGYDLRSALRDLLQRGGQLPSGRQTAGLRDLLERLRQRRQQELRRYNMDSVMDGIREQLDNIIQTEREGIERRLQEDARPGGGDTPGADGQAGEQGGQQFREMLENLARRRLEQLDNLPPQAGGRIQQLRDYDFMDADARQQFQELLASLQQQMLEHFFQGMKQSLSNMTPEGLDQIQEMVQDLNELLEANRRGDSSGFQDFMNKWGQFFPPGIENVEQLAQHLQQQMAQMQSLLDAMSPEQRRELNQMVQQMFGKGGLERDLAELMMNLDAMFPNAHGRSLPFTGDDPLTLQEAMRLMGEMKGLEDLEQDLLRAVRDHDASSLDPQQIEELLGEEARRMAEEIKELERLLEEAGLVQRNGREWELTPRALRKIGERALDDIFGRIDRGLTGDHTLRRNGWGAERLEETKPYVFGDAFNIDLPGTMKNAVRREGAGTPVRLNRDDFEVYRTASMDQCSTVVLLDMSQSMHMRGRFHAGRKVAMALDSLIRYKFPRDVLYLAAFSYFVRPLTSRMLLENYWIETGGTDFVEALRGARAMLKRHHEGTKQIILITDGEPHASVYGYGYGYGRYDGGWNMRDAMEDTLREVARCTKEGITVNTFMLDTSPVMTSFIRALARLNKGRIFFADPHQLGEYLIVDYLQNRRRRT